MYNPNTFDTVLRLLAPSLLQLRLLFPLKKRPVRTEGSAFFVFGSGRNGSTLLNRLLNTHSSLFLPTEQYFLTSLLYRYVFYNHLSDEDLWMKMNELILKDELSTWNKARLPTSLPKPLPDFESIIDHIFRTYGLVGPNTIWGDTTPVNTESALLLKKFLPNSKFIFFIRDGRDVVTSYQRNRSSFDHLPTLESQADFWIKSLNLIDKWTAPRLLVRYEELVRNPQGNLKKVYDFLEVEDQSDNWMHYQDQLRDPFFELPQHQNVSKLPNENSIGNWRTELTEEQKAFCDRKMRRYLLKYGYEVDE